MKITLRHLRAAERSMLKADMCLPIGMTESQLCLQLHRSMVYLEMAIACAKGGAKRRIK
jgi:hypothetical protein